MFLSTPGWFACNSIQLCTPGAPTLVSRFTSAPSGVVAALVVAALVVTARLLPSSSITACWLLDTSALIFLFNWGMGSVSVLFLHVHPCVKAIDLLTAGIRAAHILPVHTGSWRWKSTPLWVLSSPWTIVPRAKWGTEGDLSCFWDYKNVYLTDTTTLLHVSPSQDTCATSLWLQPQGQTIGWVWIPPYNFTKQDAYFWVSLLSPGQGLTPASYLRPLEGMQCDWEGARGEGSRWWGKWVKCMQEWAPDTNTKTFTHTHANTFKNRRAYRYYTHTSHNTLIKHTNTHTCYSPHRSSEQCCRLCFPLI